jgi:hypothetical protein
MLKCNQCSKSLRTLQGLKGHIRIKHSNANIEPLQNTNNNYSENNNIETYPFDAGISLTPELYNWANLYVLCGFTETIQEAIYKVRKMLRLIVYHDPEFFARLRNKESRKTVHDLVKLGWFFEQVGMATDFEDYAKKLRAFIVLDNNV